MHSSLSQALFSVQNLSSSHCSGEEREEREGGRGGKSKYSQIIHKQLYSSNSSQCQVYTHLVLSSSESEHCQQRCCGGSNEDE